MVNKRKQHHKLQSSQWNDKHSDSKMMRRIISSIRTDLTSSDDDNTLALLSFLRKHYDVVDESYNNE